MSRSCIFGFILSYLIDSTFIMDTMGWNNTFFDDDAQVRHDTGTGKPMIMCLRCARVRVQV